MSSTRTASSFPLSFQTGFAKPLRPLWKRIKHREYVKRWKKRNPTRVKALGRVNYRRNRAKFCARSRKNYRLHPRIRLKADLKRRYNMHIEEFDRLLAEQSGVCAICGEQERKFSRLSVDHDHSDNKIRGLLCSACNSGLGRFRDKQELLIKALEYLRNAQLAPKS